MHNAPPHIYVGFLLSGGGSYAPRQAGEDHSCFGRGDAHQHIHLYPVEGVETSEP